MRTCTERRAKPLTLRTVQRFGGPAGYTQAATPTLRTADWLFSRPERTSAPARLREALLGRNRAILQSILEQLTAVNRDAVLLVVSNPVDVLTGYTLELSGFPAERVIGSGTVLDTARIKCLLGKNSAWTAEMCTPSCWASTATVKSRSGRAPISRVRILTTSALLPELMIRKACLPRSRVRSLTQRMISSSAKGATCYGIAMAVRRIAEAIIRDEHAVLPVSTLARGAYGIEGVCLGLPAVVGRSGVSQVLDLPLSRDETERLLASAHKLKTLMEGMNKAAERKTLRPCL